MPFQYLPETTPFISEERRSGTQLLDSQYTSTIRSGIGTCATNERMGGMPCIVIGVAGGDRHVLNFIDIDREVSITTEPHTDLRRADIMIVAADQPLSTPLTGRSPRVNVGTWYRCGAGTGPLALVTGVPRDGRDIEPVVDIVLFLGGDRPRATYEYVSAMVPAAPPLGFRSWVRQCIFGLRPSQWASSLAIPGGIDRRVGGVEVLDDGNIIVDLPPSIRNLGPEHYDITLRDER